MGQETWDKRHGNFWYHPQKGLNEGKPRQNNYFVWISECPLTQYTHAFSAQEKEVKFIDQ